METPQCGTFRANNSSEARNPHPYRLVERSVSIGGEDRKTTAIESTAPPGQGRRCAPKLEETVQIHDTNEDSALGDSPQNELKTITERVHSLLHRSCQDVILLGRELLRAKELLPHGGFGPWLEEEFNSRLSSRTAQNFMKVAKRFGDKSENFSDLNVSSLYLLAAPSTSQDVVDGVLSGEIQPSLKDIGAARTAERRGISTKHAPKIHESRVHQSKPVTAQQQADRWPEFLTRFDRLMAELPSDFGLGDPDSMAEATFRALGDAGSRKFIAQHAITLRAMVAILDCLRSRCPVEMPSTEDPASD
jgi:Protein of unknown function (DUF3102)